MNTETITHEQIKELYKTAPGIKDMFPSVFEPYQAEKWYKIQRPKAFQPEIDALVFNTGEDVWYGFIHDGSWGHYASPVEYTYSFVQASESEVLEALKKEAEKRGYDHVKPNYACVRRPDFTFSEFKGEYFLDDNELRFGKLPTGNCIMKDGKWAEIIPTQKEMTVSEIEKELGYKIKIIGQ